jgi:acyl-CoA dehydrogenase
VSRQPPRAFFEKEVTPNVDKYIDQYHVDHDLWHKAGELGPLCLSIPGEYGGGGGTFAHEAVLIEEHRSLRATAAAAPTPWPERVWNISPILSAAMPAFFGR